MGHSGFGFAEAYATECRKAVERLWRAHSCVPRRDESSLNTVHLDYARTRNCAWSVAYALVRAASRLISTPVPCGLQISVRRAKRREYSLQSALECVRHPRGGLLK